MTQGDPWGAGCILQSQLFYVNEGRLNLSPRAILMEKLIAHMVFKKDVLPMELFKIVIMSFIKYARMLIFK